MSRTDAEVCVCLGCGGVFQHPKLVTEVTGERCSVSPCCGEAWASARRCSGCGRWMAEHSGLHGLCPDCARNAAERFRKLLIDEFSQEEREVLNDAFDGVPLTRPEQGRISPG